MSEREPCFVCGSIQGTRRFAITVDGEALNLAPFLCDTHGARYLLRSGILIASLELTESEFHWQTTDFALTRSQVEQLERRTHSTFDDGIVAVKSRDLAELVAVYKRHLARCASCGFERYKHIQSPCCAGFEGQEK